MLKKESLLTPRPNKLVHPKAHKPMMWFFNRGGVKPLGYIILLLKFTLNISFG